VTEILFKQIFFRCRRGVAGLLTVK
jgi:hypothetical protein